MAVVLAVTLVAARWAGATESPKPGELDLTKPAAAATVERICERAVENIARRYNLNKSQKEVTDEMMKQGVGKFLKEHEEEVWPVIRELLARQLQPPDNPEDLQRIGKVARRLAKLAEEAIFEANEEWRQILTEDQKRMHDFDLAEMEKTFSQIDRNFADWEQGQGSDRPIFPPPQVVNKGPGRPRKPEGEELPRPREYSFEVTIFDTFVEEFIKDYELDAAQVEAARSILEEFKSKANDFKASKKTEFAKIEAERQAAFTKGDYAAAATKDAEFKKLLGPVYQLFGQMQSRLTNLLTTTQRERHASKGKTAAPEEKSPVTKKRRVPTKKSAPKKSSSPKPATAEAKPDQPDPKARKDKG